MLKISYASRLGLSLAISVQFALKMCVAAKNHEKFMKTPNFGNSRSLKVIVVDKTKKHMTALVIISNMSVTICNRFHTRRANIGKIMSF